MPPSEDKNTTTCSNHVSFVAENDYVDIVWQNGKALMSSRTRRFPSCSNLPSHCSKYRKFGTMEYEFGDSGEMGLKKEDDDDVVPCFDDSLQHEQHCSEFVSGVTARTHNLSSSLGTRSSVRNQDLVPHSRSLVSMNFPQFSLPAALVKASLENRVKETSIEERGSTRQENREKCKQVGSSSVPDGEKVASSSVCSGCNSIDRYSDGETRDLKRKSRDEEDSEGSSEDEEGSMNVKREARGKRCRVARVHNLPERVRRDRIREKMRALQELIPNCNKADKASMLDEAIEYVKTLQLQLQVMSMGAGLLHAAPPMMLPPAMQHFPMVGMNYDMIGGYPQMQSTHFSASPMFGPSAMYFGPPCP